MLTSAEPNHILLIHREPLLCYLTSAMLRDRQRVDAVRTPEQAIQLLSDRTYTVVLYDLCAIESRSWEMLQALLTSARCPPVVVLTTDTTAETRKRVFDLGAAGMLYRPFNIEALRAMIARVTPPN